MQQPKKVATFVGKRVALYQEENDSWKADHDQAMACFRMEELLRQGVELYELIHRLDVNWRLAVLRKTCEYDKTADEQTGDLLKQWLQISSSVSESFTTSKTEYEARSFDREVVGRFFASLDECRSIVAPQETQLVNDKMVELRDSAIDEFHAGKTVEMEEITD